MKSNVEIHFIANISAIRKETKMPEEKKQNPGETCERSCDGWEAMFCCARCHYLGIEDCDRCDPWDI